MRLLVVHPGASWATHDVHTGLVAGLKATGHEVAEYALDGRIAASAVWLEWLHRRQQRAGGPLAGVRPSHADVQYHAGQGLLERALRLEAEWVVVVCAAYLHPDCLILARRAGLKLAAVFTESPYDDAEQAKVAPLFDVCFTNERLSAPLLRAYNPRTWYLPMGYDPAAHGPGAVDAYTGCARGSPTRRLSGAPGRRTLSPEGAFPHATGSDPAPSASDQSVPSHDVVFVGTGFASRREFFGAVDWSGIDVGLYGYWDDLPDRHPLRPYVHDALVDNARAGALYRHARIGLNLYRGTGGAAADSLNPRAYELAADGVFTLSTPRAEVFERFGPQVPTFRTPTELRTLLRHFLRHDATRAEHAARLPAVVAEDTYHHRAAELVGRLAS